MNMDSYLDDDDTNPSESNVRAVNRALNFLQISPIRLRKLRSQAAVKRKSDQIGAAALSFANTGSLPEPVQAAITVETDEMRIMKDVASKYDEKKRYDEKVQLLTVAASANWSVSRIARFFKCSDYLAAKAISVYTEKGIFGKPEPRVGVQLSVSTVQSVKEFYLNDKISRQLPGMRDVVIIKSDCGKEYLQKKLLLHTLKACYEQYKSQYPDMEIGFSKFAELKPPQCVYPNTPGTLQTCMCILHSNAKLLEEAVMKLQWDPEVDLSWLNYKSLLPNTMCKTSGDKCHFGECEDCPDAEDLKTRITDFLFGACDQVTFCQWDAKERCHLEKMTKDVPDFF